MKNVFIVMDVKDESISLFEIGGIFTGEKKAYDACITENHCYAKVELNYIFGIETTYLDCVFPIKGIVYLKDGNTQKFEYQKA